MTNRFRLLSILLLCTLSAFSQSKKDQIKALNHSVDSLSTVLTTTRDNSTKKVGVLNTTIDSLNTVLSTTRDNASNDIGGLNTTIDGLNSELAQLRSDVSSLESFSINSSSPKKVDELTIQEIGDKVGGAGCNYCLTEDYQKSYAFIDNMSGELYMSINEKAIVFPYSEGSEDDIDESEEEKSQVFDKKDFYEADGYKVIIEINVTHEADDYDDISIGSGFMTIIGINGEIMKTIIHEQCGT